MKTYAMTEKIKKANNALDKAAADETAEMNALFSTRRKRSRAVLATKEARRRFWTDVISEYPELDGKKLSIHANERIAVEE